AARKETVSAAAAAPSPPAAAARKETVSAAAAAPSPPVLPTEPAAQTKPDPIATAEQKLADLINEVGRFEKKPAAAEPAAAEPAEEVTVDIEDEPVAADAAREPAPPVLLAPTDRAPRIVRQRAPRVERWRAMALLMTLLAFGLGGLIAAWRYAPERLPQPLQPHVVLNLSAPPTPRTPPSSRNSRHDCLAVPRPPTNRKRAPWGALKNSADQRRKRQRTVLASVEAVTGVPALITVASRRPLPALSAMRAATPMPATRVAHTSDTATIFTWGVRSAVNIEKLFMGRSPGGCASVVWRRPTKRFTPDYGRQANRLHFRTWRHGSPDPPNCSDTVRT